jgi:hypothetical protein
VLRTSELDIAGHWCGSHVTLYKDGKSVVRLEAILGDTAERGDGRPTGSDELLIRFVAIGVRIGG